MAPAKQEMNMRNEVPSLEWANLILGACLACATFFFTDFPVTAWNAAIVSTLILCCFAMALYRYGTWAEWVNITLGCWAVVAPFLLDFTSTQAPLWTHALIGLCVATIATMQLLLAIRGGGCPQILTPPATYNVIKG
jgi:hypothetical protein